MSDNIEERIPVRGRCVFITSDGLYAGGVVELEFNGAYPLVVRRACAQPAVDFFKEPRPEAPVRVYERHGWAVTATFVPKEQVPRYVEVTKP